MPTITIRTPIHLSDTDKDEIRHELGADIIQILRIQPDCLRINIIETNNRRTGAELSILKGTGRAKLDKVRIAICSAIADHTGIAAGAVEYRQNELGAHDHSIGGVTYAELRRHRTR